MSATDEGESPERLRRPLIRLAKMASVATSYVGQSSDYHEIDDDVLVAVLAALGIDASTEDATRAAAGRLAREQGTRPVAPTVVCTAGERSSIAMNTPILQLPTADITLENGVKFEGELSFEPSDNPHAQALDDVFYARANLVVPPDLPVGYHTLHIHIGEQVTDATLICAPGQVPMFESMERGHLWGWMAQLYSIRSNGSWGIGDFEDLKTLLVGAKLQTGADFILINPLHAVEPVSPLTPSPYLPVSRRFINFTYIRPETIDEYAQLDDTQRLQIERLHEQCEPLNGDAQILDRDTMWRSKMRALWLIYKAGRSGERQSGFDAFKARLGDALDAYATWCLCYDKWGKPDGSPDSWRHACDIDAHPVQELREQYPDTFDFYRWLEWVAFDQLDQAQRAAERAGMAIGIMSDMAVGVHADGSDVWADPDLFAHGVSVGAPPDYFNQLGQNWSQPPLNPHTLCETGYRAYRELIHGMFEHAGAVRIDHILGLFRLWWIPEGQSPEGGAYVYYDHEALLGILAIEATRAHGVVVGEDLGVVPRNVAKVLERHRILGCDVEWFEQLDGVFIEPAQWRRYALASVNTHDMPPSAGYLRYEHVAVREELGLLGDGVEEFKVTAVNEREAMLDMLVSHGYLDEAVLGDEDAHEQMIVEALHRALVDSPSVLRAAAIADGVGERRTQNQPGTNNEYPNWRVPLADGRGNVVALENLYDNARLKSLAAVMRGK